MIPPVFRLVPLLFVLAAVCVAAWWWPNRAVVVGAAGVGEKLNSVSFAPFRAGQSPLAERFPSEAEVDADLALLAPRTRGIRTYAAIEGDYDLPGLARKHGLQVWLGIWLGADRAQNNREIARGIALANRYSDSVVRVVVGNEVLLRRDLPMAELVAAIDHVKQAVRQPVTYGDVWEFWEQFPEVARHVDIVTIHLLPYWEDDPTGIAGAVAHVGAVYRRMAALFAGKPVAIGETGWPSAGRARRDAVPSRVNQAIFIREFLALARQEGFDYNLIEAFDQVWKYKSEGSVGASWGLFSVDRGAKFSPDGVVVERPDFPQYAAGSIVCGFFLVGFALWRRPGLGARGQAALAVLGMIAGAALAYGFAGTLPLIFDNYLLAAAAMNLPAQALLAVLLMERAGAVLAGENLPPARNGAQATAAVRALFRLRLPPRAAWLEDLLFVFLWTAAVMQLLLLFDPRYRDFSLPVFAVPLVAVLVRAALRDLPRDGGGREEFFVGGTLLLASIASAVNEGALNHQSLIWNAAALVLACPALLRLTRGA
jgi:exo-beta-1,3-glucanase (GH17 family)